MAGGLGPHRPPAPATGAWGSGSHPLQMTRKPEQWPGLSWHWLWPGEQGSSFPAERGGGQLSAFSEVEAAGLCPPICAGQLYRAGVSAGTSWGLSLVLPPDLSAPYSPSTPSSPQEGPQTGPGLPAHARLPVMSSHPHAGWRVSLFREGPASRKSLTFGRFTDSCGNAWPSSGPTEKVGGGPVGRACGLPIPVGAQPHPACMPAFAHPPALGRADNCSHGVFTGAYGAENLLLLSAVPGRVPRPGPPSKPASTSPAAPSSPPLHWNGI